MARITIPYLVSKPGKGGTRRWFWQPSKALRALGWRPVRLCRPDGLPVASEAEAIDAARARNAELAAWRAGAALPGQAPLAEVEPRSLAALIRAYQASGRWAKLAPKTARDYGYHLRTIEAWAGDVPVAALTRQMVHELYETLQPAAPAKANALVRVLRIVLRYGWDKGWADRNVAEKPGLIGTAPRLRIWSEGELAALTAAADRLGWPSIGDAVHLAVYLGQRQGDILALLELQLQAAGDVLRARLAQGKTGARVDIPLHPRLAARLAAARARRQAQAVTAPTVVWHDRRHARWKPDEFRKTFALVRAAAVAGEPGRPPCPSLASAWFLDLRDTAVTRLAEAGCTVPEICAITGHQPDSAYQILRHYLATTGELASAAIAKLIAHEAALRARHEAPAC